MRYRMDYTLIKRKLPSGKVVYYYAIYDEDNKRIYRSTGEKSKAKADAYVRSLQEKGRLGIIDRYMTTLKDYAADFFIPGKCPIEKYNHTRGKSMTKATLSVRRAALVEHIFPYLGSHAVYNISPKLVNKWLMEVPEKDGVSRTTANTYLVALRLVMEQAVRDGIVKTNPCMEVENLGSDTTRRQAFTIDEVRSIIGREEDWANPMIRSMCLVAAVTGMRMGEVRALKPECVTREAIIIKASFSNADGYKMPKNGKERLSPIPEGVYEEIMKYRNGDGYIFRMYLDDKPVSASWIKKSLDKRMKDLGIKDKSFHGFREFFNTQMMSANVNETSLRAVIGHADANMTNRYLHIESAEFPVFREAQLGLMNKITIG